MHQMTKTLSEWTEPARGQCAENWPYRYLNTAATHLVLAGGRNKGNGSSVRMDGRKYNPQSLQPWPPTLHQLIPTLIPTLTP